MKAHLNTFAFYALFIILIVMEKNSQRLAEKKQPTANPILTTHYPLLTTKPVQP